jgi:sarcosine oxidase gamma subunit
VDQTGGLTVWEVTGGRARDLFERLGSAASMPPLGEARTSRMADLSVLAMRVEEAATLLVVDRLYAEHLLGWVEAIAADF